MQDEQKADQQEAVAVVSHNTRAEGPAHLTNLRLAAVAAVPRRLTQVTRDIMTVKAVGRVLGYPNLDELLRARGLLDASGLPYPQYENCKLFAREKRADGSMRALVLPLGMTWIATAFPPIEQPA